MKRSQRFERIVELAKKRESEAMRILGQCQARRQHLYEKAETLRKYRDDYSRSFTQMGENGLTARVLQDYRSFLSRLNQALRDQERQLQEVESELNLRRKACEEAHRRKVTLAKVHASSRRAEEKIVEQREQREMDDRAANGIGDRWSIDEQSC